MDTNDTNEQISRADFAPVEMENASAEVEATRTQIEETRAQMTETINAIKENLSPATLVAEARESIKEATVGKAEQLAETVVEKAKDATATATDALQSVAGYVSEKAGPVLDTARDVARNVGATAKGTGETIVDTIRINPLPAAMIGFGIGWLALSMRKQYNGGDPYPNRGRAIYESESQYNSQTYDEFKLESGLENSGSTGATMKETWDNAGSAVNNFATSAKSKASDLAAATKEKAQEGYSALDQWVHENPLAAGAVALLVGAAVGLALPATAKENEVLGPKRDELAQKAAETAQDVVGKVQTVAEKAIGTAKHVLGDATQQIKTEVQTEAQNQALPAA